MTASWFGIQCRHNINRKMVQGWIWPYGAEMKLTWGSFRVCENNFKNNIYEHMQDWLFKLT